MSGHNKWSSIKGKKGVADAQRGKIFSNLAKEITSAARVGGGNPDNNNKLRTFLAKAREANMPSDNVERAIKRGTGELPGVSYEEMTIEGYGPGGAAIIVEGLTDNKNRTTADIRTIFSRRGGSFAGAGSVSWMFHKKGFIVVDKKTIDEDKLMNLVLESGAEDMSTQEENYEITTTVQDFEKVKKALTDASVKCVSAEVTMIPSNTIKLTGNDAKTAISLVAELEDLDDVQNVYANFDIPDDIIKEISGE